MLLHIIRVPPVSASSIKPYGSKTLYVRKNIENTFPIFSCNTGDPDGRDKLDLVVAAVTAANCHASKLDREEPQSDIRQHRTLVRLA